MRLKYSPGIWDVFNKLCFIITQYIGNQCLIERTEATADLSNRKKTKKHGIRCFAKHPKDWLHKLKQGGGH